MKFDWIEKQNGAYWAFVKNNNIICMSGCHPFKQYENAYHCFEFLGPSPIDYDEHISHGE